MLLYGPPGCGKTLIARQIGKVLNAREPKIVNGPEVLDKYVGGSEEKIRALFADAEEEQANAGDESMLHIVIFDEVQCPTRGGKRARRQNRAGCDALRRANAGYARPLAERPPAHEGRRWQRAPRPNAN